MAVVSTQIEIDEQGVAWLTGANVKVIEVALDKLAHGWSPEEIHFQHPHLSLAQIHAALGYYYDHKAEIDAGKFSKDERGYMYERLFCRIVQQSLATSNHYQA